MLIATILAGTLLTQQISRLDVKDKSFENAKSTGWYTHYAGSAAWDPKTVIQFAGKVIGLIESSKSVDLMVKVQGGGTAFVDLGPKEYFEGQALHISAQDAVKISGSKVMVNGESLILCQQLNHKGSKIAFRTQDGRPFWSLK